MKAARTLFLLLAVWPFSLAVGMAGMFMGITKYVLLSVYQTWSANDQ